MIDIKCFLYALKVHLSIFLPNNKPIMIIISFVTVLFISQQYILVENWIFEKQKLIFESMHLRKENKYLLSNVCILR